jgi:hypothetical protein
MFANAMHACDAIASRKPRGANTSQNPTSGAAARSMKYDPMAQMNQHYGRNGVAEADVDERSREKSNRRESYNRKSWIAGN